MRLIIWSRFYTLILKSFLFLVGIIFETNAKSWKNLWNWLNWIKKWALIIINFKNLWPSANNFCMLLSVPSIIYIDLDSIIVIDFSTLNTFPALSLDRIMRSVMIFSFTQLFWLVLDTEFILLVYYISVSNLIFYVNHQRWFLFNIFSFYKNHFSIWIECNIHISNF